MQDDTIPIPETLLFVDTYCLDEFLSVTSGGAA
jgi:hypothetical protein